MFIVDNTYHKMSAGVESTANEYEHVSKKQKEEKCTENGIKRLHENLHDLSSFKVRKVLSNNTNRKVVCLEGSFDCKEGVGLIVLEKTAFQDEDFTNEGGSDYFTEKSVLKKQFHNDIYGNYEFYPKADLNCRLCFVYGLVHFVKLSFFLPASC